MSNLVVKRILRASACLFLLIGISGYVTIPPHYLGIVTLLCLVFNDALVGIAVWAIRRLNR